MKKLVAILSVLLSAVITNAAQAQTPPLPQVTPVLTATSCLGDWQMNVYNGAVIEARGNSQQLLPSSLTIRITSGQPNQDGTTFCSGSVVGINGSNANLFFDPRTNFIDFNIDAQEPSLLSGSQMYQLHIYLRLFTTIAGPYNPYFFGTMEGTFYEFPFGPAVPKILYHGNADLGRSGSGAKGRPMPGN